ncbi:MAG: class I SAM-dependent methyltransferase [Candidatus Lokiarchaeota archaeon]|nr:class I SAM-dependent methyltransferase [Candidatus Lokiarchaeota archaeon]
MIKINSKVKEHINFITKFIERGGPNIHEYELIDSWFGKIYNEVKSGVLQVKELKCIRKFLIAVFSVETLIGFTLIKPHGYAGDYEIIDKIYQKHINPDQKFKKWDLYYNAHKASMAVRKRKEYFKNLVRILNKKNNNNSEIEILNIGSGPTRDIFEFLSEDGINNIHFECVDIDQKAISYSKNLCKAFLGKITFHHNNIFHFSTNKKYDLIWSAGLFDYLNDISFIHLVKKCLALLRKDGELVIGNISKDHKTIEICSVLDWIMYHRDKDDLIKLLSECVIQEDNMRIIGEDEKVEGCFNFLHIKPSNLSLNHNSKNNRKINDIFVK